MVKRVLVPLPDRDFDTTEVAVPWKLLTEAGLVLARAIDPTTGRSVLSGRRTSCLPKYTERAAYFSTFWKLGRYDRTYPAYVEDEVRGAGATIVKGPFVLSKRGTREDDAPAFVVEDGNYVSARWPGDAYLFTKRFLARL